MFVGIIVISLIFFWLLGLKRMATFLYLVKLSLSVVQMTETPKSHSTLALYRDFARYSAKGLKEDPLTLLGIFVTVPTYIFIGILSLFTDKYFLLNLKAAEELNKLFSTMSTELEIPLMDHKTTVKAQVIFSIFCTMSYKFEFSNAGLHNIREVASFIREKDIEVSQLTDPIYMKELSKNLQAHLKN